MNKRLLMLLMSFFLTQEFCFTRVDSEPVVEKTALAISASDELNNFQADKIDFATDNQADVAAIEAELAKLHKIYGDKNVDLENNDVKRIAPKIVDYVSTSVGRVAELAKIPKPGVKLVLKKGNTQYNAAALQARQKYDEIQKTYEIHPVTGKKKLIAVEKIGSGEEKLSDVLVGAQLVRLFVWRKDTVSLMAAVLGHEIGHIVFDHQTQVEENEYEADLLALKLLKKGSDLNKALDMLSLAAHMYNSLEKMGLRQNYLYDVIRSVVNRAIIDVPTLGEVGSADTHSYAATAIFNALQRVNKKSVVGSNLSDACVEVYRAIKLACLSPSTTFGGIPSKKIRALCQDMERKANYLKQFTKTHPSPRDRRTLIEKLADK